MKRKIAALIFAVMLLVAATCPVAYAIDTKSPPAGPQVVKIDVLGSSANFLPFILTVPIKY